MSRKKRRKRKHRHRESAPPLPAVVLASPRRRRGGLAILAIALVVVGAAGIRPIATGEVFPLPFGLGETNDLVTSDVCIYGATSAGVVAAAQAMRMGHTVAILEPGDHIGGMTAGGLGATDIGTREAIGGLAAAFYARVREHYSDAYGARSQQARDCQNGYQFEPHVAEGVFGRMLAGSAAPVYRRSRLVGVTVKRGRMTEIRTEGGTRFRALVYLDCSYEGDLMAQAGVPFTVGREANSTYGETLNGNQPGRPYHNFRVAVSPYVVPGDAASGLLPGVGSEPAGSRGEADSHVQAYNFRMCLTKVAENRIPFSQPEGYDPVRYELLLRYSLAGVWDALNLTTPLPNGKTDTNNHGAVSTDYIGMSDQYPRADWPTRERIIREHESYQKGMMWFLANDSRVPPSIRGAVSQWGLAKDEFIDNGGWPHQIYVREARRMVSDLVITEHDCMGRTAVPDAIGLASYAMDSHHCRRYVENGQARNEGDVQVNVPRPFAIPYRAIVPPRESCQNLLVPVCLSASHIAFGSIRMEPVFMILGQSAATAACLAIDDGWAVQDVDAATLVARLRADGQIVEWAPPKPAPPKPLRRGTNANRKPPTPSKGATAR